MAEKEKTQFLSHRIAQVLAATQLLLVLLLGWLWYFCIHNNGYYLAGAICTLAFLVQLLWLYFGIYRPYKETEKMMLLFARGYTMEGVFEVRHPVTPATREAVLQVQQLLSTDQLLGASRRQAQFLALQNQINPHFLYNTLEGIRSDALVAGLDNVAQMTEALSTFFRYTISNVENLVTLEEEIGNIENYFKVQKYRFGERLQLAVEFDGEADRSRLMKAKMPKLTLQPILENAIVHGIEGKVGEGKVTVKVQGTEKRMIVTVQDDGLGMSGESLKTLRDKLNSVYYDYIRPDKEKSGGIALVNVNNRIRLLFGESYGIEVYSTPGQGTDVVVTLPYSTKANRVEAAG